jgi:DnaJ-class molecular chaperone
LGIPSTSGEAEIKHTFRQKALKVHPDVGGSAEEFKKLYTAYEDCMHQVAPSLEINLYDLFPEESPLTAIFRAMVRAGAQYVDVNSLFGMKVNFTYGRKRSKPSQESLR